MGPYADEAERCIRCGFCNSVCPTTLTSIGYAPSKTSRGRLVLLQSALESGRPEPFTERFKDLIDLCIGCLRCVSVCPARIPIPTVMSAYRYAYYRASRGKSLTKGEKLLAKYEFLMKTLSMTPEPLRRATTSGPLLRLFRRVGGFAADVKIPLPEGEPLDRYFRGGSAVLGPETYAYFSDTYARFVRPSIGVSAMKLLENVGIALTYPRQFDSGIVYWELGLWQRVERLASRNVESLYREVSAGRKILCTSPASTLMLREVYPQILNNVRSVAVSESVVDINELLHQLADSGRLSANLKPARCVVHSSCLSQHLRLTKSVVDMLEKLGVRVEGVATECCGSGGVWGLFERNRRLSLEIGERLVRKLGSAEVVLSYSETCSLQISSLLKNAVEVILPHEALNSWLRQTASPTHPEYIAQAP